jgi:hypothetical protein
MGTITDAIAEVWRDYVTEGLPATGAAEPDKSEIRALGPIIEAAMSSVGLAGMVDVAYSTQSALNADLAHAAGTVGLVYADATDANNDIYTKTGSSGSGSWTLTPVLHGIIDALTADLVADWTAIAAQYATIATALGDPATPLGPNEFTGIVAAYDVSDTKIELAGGGLIDWPNNARTRSLKRFGAKTPPRMIQRDRVTFDGTSSALQNFVGSLSWTLVSETRLPASARCNTAGSPGGWPNTGLARDRWLNWIIGHDGRFVGTGANVEGNTNRPRLVIVTPDFRSIVREIDLSVAPFSVSGTVQGVVHIKGATEADDVIWFTDAAGGRIMCIDAAGTMVKGVIAGYTAGALNGLAYDPTETVFYFTSTADNIVRVIPTAYAASAPTPTRTFDAGQNLDHLFYSPTRNLLLGSYGTNGNNGSVQSLEPVRGRLLGTWAGLSRANAIEGIYEADGQLIVMHDGGYHGGVDAAGIPNPYCSALVYRLDDNPTQVSSTILMLAGVMRVPSLKAGTGVGVIWETGDPLTDADHGGVLLSFKDAAHTLQIDAKMPGIAVASRYQKTFPMPGTVAVGDFFMFTLILQPGSDLANLFVNGTAVTSGAVTTGDFSDSIGSTLYFPNWMVGAHKPWNSDTLDQFSNAEIKALEVFTTSTDRTKVEGYLAWRFGLTSKLPGGHAYKSVPPQ